MLLSKLALGTAQFGLKYGISARKKVGSKEVGPILEVAKQFGITMIDTAPSYGEAEAILGNHDLSAFKVITKTLPKQQNTDTVLLAFLASLEKLKLKSVYGLLIHQTSDQNLLDQIELLKDLKQRGYTQRIGASVYSPYELRSLLRRFTPDIVSLPLNVFDQRFADDKELIDLIVKHNIEVHARSVFLQGVVFMDHLNLPSHLEPVKDKLAVLTPHMALEFVKQQLFADYCTVGIESLNQFLDLCNLWGNDIPTRIDFSAFKIDDPKIINPSLWPN